MLKQLIETISTADYLDSRIVVVHLGFVSSRKYKREGSFQLMVESLKRL